MNFFERNIPVWGERGQRRIRSSRVAIIGFGGIGQATFVNLLRAGVKRFSVVDPDYFDISNMNRQSLCFLGELGKKKIKSAEKYAKSINPEAALDGYAEKFCEKNAAKILEGCDIAIDGLDTFSDRVVLHRECRKRGIPSVFCSALGSMGMCSVFDVESRFDFEEVFSRAGRLAKRCDSIVSPAAQMAGTLASALALAVILKRPHVCAPEFILFDVFSKRPVRNVRLA
ncbi:MAG: ThiF family adenylyltransferase [Candidatus Anstonellales archaeon]